MSHQVALTVVAPVRDEAVVELRRLLTTMGDGVSNGTVFDFGAFRGLHFARFVLVDEATDLRGAVLPASLLYLADVDLPKDRHLAELAEANPDGVDWVFGHCVGYPARPTPQQRLAFLRDHTVKEQARYVNTIGRTAQQIRQEAGLHDRLEEYLDEREVELRGHDPVEIRRDVQRLLEGDEDLHWSLRPAERLELSFRLRELGHAIAMPLLLLLVLPLLLVCLPFYLVVLRLHERRDPAPHVKAPPELVQDLASLEDHLVHNPFTAVGLIKAGPFRMLTLLGVLAAIDYGTRHIWNRGNLAGVKTIHFARWIFLDGRRRMIFASNYDGSLENYMDDFIDKISWGLNIVFSNGFGYPRTRWLVLEGANDELAFKDYLRLHQVPTRVWYSGYGHLTLSNIANNERIRIGLREYDGEEEAAEWLHQL